MGTEIIDKLSVFAHKRCAPDNKWPSQMRFTQGKNSAGGCCPYIGAFRFEYKYEIEYEDTESRALDDE